MTRRGISLLAIALLGAVVLDAQSPIQAAASLVARSGTVEVQRGDAWWPISAGEPLVAADRVRTAAGSSAALEIGPGRIVTLNERSEIQLRPANLPSGVLLEAGSIKVFSTSDIQLAAKGTTLDTAD